MRLIVSIAVVAVALFQPTVAAAGGKNDGAVGASASGNRIEVTVTGGQPGQNVAVGDSPLAGCVIVAGLSGPEVIDLAGGTGIQIGVTSPDMENSDETFVFVSCPRRVFDGFSWAVWQEGDPVPGEVIDALAEAARAAIVLPIPHPETAPDGLDTPFLTQLDVWLWVDDEAWQPRSATASLTEIGLWVTATATPVETRWRTGAEATPELRCGQGTPWTADAASTDCSVVYTSVTPPGTSRDLVVTTSFDVAVTCTPVVCDPAAIQLGGIDVVASRPVTVTEARGVISR